MPFFMSYYKCILYAVVEEIVQNMPYIPDAIVCEDDDVAKNVSLALLQRDAQAVRG